MERPSVLYKTVDNTTTCAFIDLPEPFRTSNWDYLFRHEHTISNTAPESTPHLFTPLKLCTSWTLKLLFEDSRDLTPQPSGCWRGLLTATTERNAALAICSMWKCFLHSSHSLGFGPDSKTAPDRAAGLFFCENRKKKSILNHLLLLRGVSTICVTHHFLKGTFSSSRIQFTNQ